MNVSCTSCSAKYAIPDEKVRGKKVKLTCKHCGTGIIVDGTKLDAPADAGAAAAGLGAASPAAPAAVAASAPAELTFDIAYPDDRQDSLRVSQIVEQYASGVLDDRAFLWREGMADSKAPFDIPEVASALVARGLKRPGTSSAGEDEEATKVQPSPFEGPSEPEAAPGVWHEPAKEAPSSPEPAFALRSSALPFEEPAPEPSPQPTPAFALSTGAANAPAAAKAPATAAVKSAARRAGARGGDLFGDLAAAGSEDDESLGVDAKDAGPKLTGARNESSVLFSLDALVKQEQKPAAKKGSPKQDDAAAILMGSDSGPSSIANVGGGGVFASALAAPDFSAPVLAPLPEARAADPVTFNEGAPAPKKGKGLWIGLGAVALLAGAAVALGLPAKLSGSAAAPTPAATTGKAPDAPAATPTSASEAPAPDASVAAAPPASAAAVTTPTNAAPAAKPAETASKPAEAAAKPAETAAKPAEATTKPAEAASKPDKPSEAPASDAPPFDKSAAISALTAAAGNAQSCKTADGPTGSGKVSITFMPSGRATNTQVSGDLAGTAVGGCVARLFRSAKIPAFSGEAVTVSKSFTIQ